ncbi:MAG TPA: pseudouridine synthase, partial [Pontibacter sp.]
ATWVEVKIAQGMNRQVRRMTAAVGYPTLRLIRPAIGPLTLGELQPGEYRDLTPEEVTQLKSLTAGSTFTKSAKKKPTGGRHYDSRQNSSRPFRKPKN